MQHAHRARILAPVVAVLVAGALALTGCRSDPAVAAYVGGTSYPLDRVSGIATEAHTALQRIADAQRRSAGESAGPIDRPVTEQQVVAALIARDVLRALAEAKRVSKVEIPVDQVAQVRGVPPDTEYVRVVAEADGYRAALLESTPAVAPPEAAVREVYEGLLRANGGQGAVTFEEFAQSLGQQNRDLVGRGAALREEISAQADTMNVTVNPRYRPAVLGVLEQPDQQGALHTLLGVPLDRHESGVVELS